MIVKVVGVTFANEKYKVNRQDIIRKLNGKEKVYLKREPKNRFDENAVAIFVKIEGKKDQKIGYIKKEIATFLADMWTEWKFTARISEIRNGSLKEKISWGISIEIKKIKKIKRRKPRRK